LLKYLATLLLFAVVVYLSVFRQMYYHPPARARAAGGNNWIANGFSVAIVWPRHADLSLVEGVTLAAEEVNAAGGPLAGKIRLRFLTEIDDGDALARSIVRNGDVLAVIGHELANTIIPASITYENHGVLFISPKSTDIRLTRHQFQFVFRLTPDDKDVANALADFAVQQKWMRLRVLYGRDDHGEAASAQFLSAAKRANLDIPFVYSVFHERDWMAQDFRPTIAEIVQEPFDALMLADQLPWAIKLLGDIERMGVAQPLIATDKLDSAEVWRAVPKLADHLYVASAVDPSSTSPAYLAFRDRFRRRFHDEPGYGATQGYEAFTLFVNACLRSNSADPIVVATTLRTNAWDGLFGKLSFTPEGDVIGRTITIKHVENGVVKTMPVVKGA
jgi:ABC-type branched-subunit amino acid transport system substrate-binding protein